MVISPTAVSTRKTSCPIHSSAFSVVPAVGAPMRQTAGSTTTRHSLSALFTARLARLADLRPSLPDAWVTDLGELALDDLVAVTPLADDGLAHGRGRERQHRSDGTEHGSAASAAPNASAGCSSIVWAVMRGDSR